ncbi:hypothetical protein [Streptacidiphilus sp. PAMC 29251]
MSADEPADSTTRWYYAHPGTVEGALQRGRGVGALWARRDPQGAELVLATMRRDHRWDWSVDERDTYLARLVRDLGMDPTPIVTQLWESDDVARSDDGNAFEVAAGVLAALARVGYGDAEQQLLRYVREGRRWVDVLQLIASEWPAERWVGLRGTALARLSAGPKPQGYQEDWWGQSEPWATWETRAPAAPVPRPRPFERSDETELLAVLAEPESSTGSKRDALFELARRPPQPALLDLAPSLTTGSPPRPVSGLIKAILGQGPAALPQARAWHADPASGLAGPAVLVLAEHGQEQDIPRLMAHWRLLRRNRQWCGYHVLADGLARLGPAAVCALPALRGMYRWTPHSYERPAALRARLAIDPRGAERTLLHGLWDSESGVRLIAARQVPLVPRSIARLTALCDDTLETEDVRAAAEARLGGDSAQK